MDSSIAPKRDQTALCKPQPTLSPTSKVVKLLAVLSEARQAPISETAMRIYSSQLSKYPLEDVEAAVTRLSLSKRRDGETAFPDLATIDEECIEAGRPRRQAEYQREKVEQALREEKHRQEHPEEYEDVRNIIAEFLLKAKTI